MTSFATVPTRQEVREDLRESRSPSSVGARGSEQDPTNSLQSRLGNPPLPARGLTPEEGHLQYRNVVSGNELSKDDLLRVVTRSRGDNPAALRIREELKAGREFTQGDLKDGILEVVSYDQLGRTLDSIKKQDPERFGNVSPRDFKANWTEVDGAPFVHLEGKLEQSGPTVRVVWPKSQSSDILGWVEPGGTVIHLSTIDDVASPEAIRGLQGVVPIREPKSDSDRALVYQMAYEHEQGHLSSDPHESSEFGAYKRAMQFAERKGMLAPTVAPPKTDDDYLAYTVSGQLEFTTQSEAVESIHHRHRRELSPEELKSEYTAVLEQVDKIRSAQGRPPLKAEQRALGAEAIRHGSISYREHIEDSQNREP